MELESGGQNHEHTPDGQDREQILSALAASVDAMDEEGAVRQARAAIEAGIEAYEAITQGLSRGMAIVSQKYETGEYFVPEILLCADAMYAAIDVLRPHLKPRGEGQGERTSIIIGVIQGDIHDIGKNIVKLMLDAAGYDVHDLGRDVPVEAFVDKARELGGGIIAMSTLMSTTMPGMARVVELLKRQGIRQQWKVMVGGGPISPGFASSIGADAYGRNAMDAVRLADEWERAGA